MLNLMPAKKGNIVNGKNEIKTVHRKYYFRMVCVAGVTIWSLVTLADRPQFSNIHSFPSRKWQQQPLEHRLHPQLLLPLLLLHQQQPLDGNQINGRTNSAEIPYQITWKMHSSQFVIQKSVIFYSHTTTNVLWDVYKVYSSILPTICKLKDFPWETEFIIFPNSFTVETIRSLTLKRICYNSNYFRAPTTWNKEH
jgi:hypothetical protein